MDDAEAVAVELAGYWLCPRCGHKLTAKGRHGWGSPWSPRKPNGSIPVVYCDEADDAEVARYRAWKANPSPLVTEAKRTLAEWEAAQRERAGSA